MTSFKEYFNAVNWQLVRDSAVIGSCLIGSSALLVMSGSNCYANLINSGAFVEMEWIAVSLSVTPAIGSLAIKLCYGLIPERFKATYALVLVGLSLVTLFSWAIFFAILFHGNASASVDINLTEAPNQSLAIGYTLAQVFSELLAAATLFLAMDQALAKYTLIDRKVENPDWLELEKQWQQQNKQNSDLLTKRLEKIGQLKKLEALRKAWIIEQTASYFNIASQLK